MAWPSPQSPLDLTAANTTPGKASLKASMQRKLPRTLVKDYSNITSKREWWDSQEGTKRLQPPKIIWENDHRNPGHYSLMEAQWFRDKPNKTNTFLTGRRAWYGIQYTYELLITFPLRARYLVNGCNILPLVWTTQRTIQAPKKHYVDDANANTNNKLTERTN